MAPRWINADKPHLWKADIAASVDQFNEWFMEFAPQTFRATRVKTTEQVRAALIAVDDLRKLDAETLRSNPGALPTLRMCMAPPLAVDRLIGLAHVRSSLVKRLETGALPPRMKLEVLVERLQSISEVLNRLLDRDIFPWLSAGQDPTDHERERVATVIADRLCSAVAKNIMREARRRHQLSRITEFLHSIGFCEVGARNVSAEPGTYRIDAAVPVVLGRDAILSFDLLIHPIRDNESAKLLAVDVGSPTDSREGARTAARWIQKCASLRMNHGGSVKFIVALGGSMDGGLLGTLAAESIDWVWDSKIGRLGDLVS